MDLQDIETFDLEDFKYNFVNMTAFRIVDAEDVGVREILKDMERFQPVGHSILNKSRIIQVGHYDTLFILWHVKRTVKRFPNCGACPLESVVGPLGGAIYLYEGYIYSERNIR
jgi:hypothetical protein